MNAATRPTIWTIGHSTQSLTEFVDRLAMHDIEALVDIRRFPGSRRVPQFGSSTLAASLEQSGIAYCWIEALGGRRRPSPDSPNDGWRHPAFRGYADYLMTEPFAEGLFELLMIAQGLRTAIMCAEVLWWRCHRRLVADVLTTLGFDVEHIGGNGALSQHRLRSPARLVKGVLSYSTDESLTS